MPKTLTGAGSSVATTLQCPLDSDLANGASIETPLQVLLNSIKALADTIFTIGVNRLQRFTSLSALASITGMTDGQRASVDNAGDYVFFATSNLAPIDGMIVAPNSGLGRWISTVFFVRGARNGIAALDGASKVPVASVPNAVVGWGWAAVQSAAIVGLQSPRAIATATLANLAVGDILLADATADAKLDRSPGPGDEGAISIASPQAQVQADFARELLDLSFRTYAVGAQLRVTAAGTVNVAVMLNPGVAGASSRPGGMLNVRVIRP